MRFIRTILMLLFLSQFSSQLIGQLYNPDDDSNLLYGGMGILWINSQPYYSLHLAPEFSFGKIGVGLDLNLEFGADGKLRNENFADLSSYFRLIRYFRYGQINEDFYLRLGALDYSTLGNGSIVYFYNNSPSFDARKIGMNLNLRFDKYGFETLYGSFGAGSVLGIRGYVNLLKFTQFSDIPVVGDVETGISIVTDLHQYAGVISGSINEENGEFLKEQTVDKPVFVGLDITFPVIRKEIVSLDVYSDFVQIIGRGHGIATGVKFGMKGLGIFDIHTKLERRINGRNYIPSYFNAFYELERFSFNKTSGEVSSKIQLLESNLYIGNGWYGEMNFNIMTTIKILGSYQRLDKEPDSGILQLRTSIAPGVLPFVFNAGYNKTNIKDESDIFNMDERSMMFVEIGYKPVPYLLVSLLYKWTFTPIRDFDENIIDYQTQRRVEPRVSFIYPLDLGG
ncbi:MAG: hypothetical protein K8F36_10355 [Melioribacteraceae bacterium]|nr:hypothetical protein [Melioribacteraceae bacterium]